MSRTIAPLDDGRLFINEDFVGAVVNAGAGEVHTGAGCWVLTSASGTPVTSVRASELSAPGILRLATSAGSGDEAILLFSAQETARISEVDIVETRFRVSSASNIAFAIGVFKGAIPGTTDDARYVTLNGTHLHAIARNTTTNSVLTAATLLANTWFTVRFSGPALRRCDVLDDNGNTIHSSNEDADGIPGSPGGVVYLAAWVKTLTTASQFLELDFVRLRTGVLSR